VAPREELSQFDLNARGNNLAGVFVRESAIEEKYAEA
jgi:hypothetical protein